MQNIPLYRYKRENGKITDSIIKPNTDYTELYRLIADEGHILTDGENFTPCIDTDEPEKWTEVEFTPEPLEEFEGENL